MQLVVENIAKSFGIHEIFKDVSFMLEQGEKVGLVGVNGGGKTTLLRCLLAPETVDGGFIKFEPGLRIGYVQQGFQGIGEGTLWQFLVNAGKDILELRQKMSELEKQVAAAKGAELDSLLADYARVSNIYEHADGYNYENRIKIVLHGLGFPIVGDPVYGSGRAKDRTMLHAERLVVKRDVKPSIIAEAPFPGRFAALGFSAPEGASPTRG